MHSKYETFAQDDGKFQKLTGAAQHAQRGFPGMGDRVPPLTLGLVNDTCSILTLLFTFHLGQ